MNKLGKEISKIMRETKGNKEAVASQLAEKAEIEKKITSLKEAVEERKKELDEKLFSVGNLIHESVPVFDDEVRKYIYFIKILYIKYFFPF